MKKYFFNCLFLIYFIYFILQIKEIYKFF